MQHFIPFPILVHTQSWQTNAIDATEHKSRSLATNTAIAPKYLSQNPVVIRNLNTSAARI